MIRLSDVPADLATRAGVMATGVATSGGWHLTLVVFAHIGGA